MNGGTFTPGVEKVRPGIYFNFQMKANERISTGDRGRVALPLVLGWGKSKEMIEISGENDARERLGVDISDPTMGLLREAKKKSATVLVYRVNEGEKATATLGESQKVTAAYGGIKGNELHVVVEPNVLDETKKDVKTFFGLREVDKQVVSSFDELQSNDFVVFEGAGVLEDTAGTNLTGGSNGTITSEDYIDFISAAESEYFDTIGLPVDDEAIKTTFVSFIRRLRDEQGVKVQGVLPNYPGNYEGIINVTNAVVLTDRELTVPETVAWVAGASAGATLQQSLTFMEYEGAVDVKPRFDNDQIEQRLQRGEFLFTFNPRDKSVTVEQDINSITGTSKMRKNKIVRILDAINNDITRSLKEAIKNRKNIGQDIPANGDGVQIVQAAISIYLNELQENNIIQNFDPSEDIIIKLTSAGDGIATQIGVQPVDSAEKFYFTVVAE
ncbi:MULTISPECIES: phage tail sheath family protein [Clostridia]|uniref:phage tail sheath family protein n=1 Tax=Clostridia TaxID=186801 RepID=UPI000EA296A5|nr:MULTISPECIES: phage tail sheath family protein [Clostridia]NBJ68911.1 phage tail sheath protein [Roseburia sp. 1XD42-34]RKI80282.1 phage tail sheath protein [Clostridium sp. 1xD42-85]